MDEELPERTLLVDGEVVNLSWATQPVTVVRVRHTNPPDDWRRFVPEISSRHPAEATGAGASREIARAKTSQEVGLG
jgi:hypothetical protein